MSLYVIQQHGIGDAIFSQTLIHSLAQDKEPIIWPVTNRYVNDLRIAYPRVTWMREDLILCTEQQRRDILTARVVPLSRAYELNGGKKVDWMKEKYSLYGRDWTQWKEKAAWQYDVNHATEILLRIGNRPFNLISDTFRNDQTGKISINVNNGAVNINMNDERWSQFTLFDWTLAISQAQSIHFVNSAILYMIEVLNTTSDLHIYDRWPDEHGFPYVWYIMSKTYTKHIHLKDVPVKPTFPADRVG